MRSCTRFLVVITFFLCSSSFLMAHGESNYGPNGGFIRMPGSFHTELVRTENPLVYKIYLLDIAFKNPTTSGSSVSLRYSGEKSGVAECTKKSNFFECRFKSKVDTNVGSLILTATRYNKKAAPAEYSLPLKLTRNSESEPASHRH